MAKENGVVALVLMCVDSRFYEGDVIADVLQQVRDAYGVDHIFLRTAAGPEGKVLRGDHHLEAIVEDAKLLIEHKGVSTVVTIGHETCAGHPVEDEASHRPHDVFLAERILADRLGSLIAFRRGVWRLQGDNRWLLEDTSSETALAAE